MGIDEAGRGPVIGPMVFCGYVLAESDVKKLKKLGVRDSKELKIDRMKKMAVELEKIAKSIIYIEVEPQVIDCRNIAFLTFEKFLELINSSTADTVYFDAPVPSRFVERYITKLKQAIDKHVEIIGDIKGDKKFPCVSAASICAKVRREERVEELKKNFGDFGSGYPGDEKTINFLRKLCLDGKFPDIVRRKWQTLKKIEFIEKQSRFAFF
jgi:ribonuclease HII